jgi:hypothetical protein
MKRHISKGTVFTLMLAVAAAALMAFPSASHAQGRGKAIRIKDRDVNVSIGKVTRVSREETAVEVAMDFEEPFSDVPMASLTEAAKAAVIQAVKVRMEADYQTFSPVSYSIGPNGFAVTAQDIDGAKGYMARMTRFVYHFAYGKSPDRIIVSNEDGSSAATFDAKTTKLRD